MKCMQPYVVIQKVMWEFICCCGKRPAIEWVRSTPMWSEIEPMGPWGWRHRRSSSVPQTWATISLDGEIWGDTYLPHIWPHKLVRITTHTALFKWFGLDTRAMRFLSHSHVTNVVSTQEEPIKYCSEGKANRCTTCQERQESQYGEKAPSPDQNMSVIWRPFRVSVSTESVQLHSICQLLSREASKPLLTQRSLFKKILCRKNLDHISERLWLFTG